MSDIFMWVAFVGLAAAVAAIKLELRKGRWLYWCGTLVACVSAFLMGYPRDWKSGLLMSGFLAAALLFAAYVYTPFLKFNGRIRAFRTSDQNAENGESATRMAGVDVSAPKAWWRNVIAMIIPAVGVLSYFKGDGRLWLAVASALVVILSAVALGYRDGRTGGAFASRQHLQFAIVAIATLGAFPVAYAASFYISRRRPAPAVRGARGRPPADPRR